MSTTAFLHSSAHAQYSTAFAIDHNGKQYLITAKHLIDPTNQKTIRFFFNRKWTDFPATLLGIGSGEIDIAVFRMEENFCNGTFPLPAQTDGMVIGQDVYFVGRIATISRTSTPASWEEGRVAFDPDGNNVPTGAHPPLSSDERVSKDLASTASQHRGLLWGHIVFKPPGKADFQIAGVVSKFKIGFEKIIS